METHQQLNNSEHDIEKKTEGSNFLKQEFKDDQAATSPASESSPSHDFSFTISFHSNSSTTDPPDKPRTPPSYALDLSPADDIFFHGHLLPLHLLSHLPSSSPRASVDSFTLPLRDLLEDEKSINGSSNIITQESNAREETKQVSSKSKSFSLFKGRRKGSEVRDKEDKEKQKRFDVKHVIKRYLRTFFRGRREKPGLHGQPYSYSGNLSLRSKSELRGRRGEYSAPASMRTSPTNSGLLLATTAFPPATDSTMEELQAAIQAAIAHCKNSIAKDEKLKS